MTMTDPPPCATPVSNEMHGTSWVSVQLAAEQHEARKELSKESSGKDRAVYEDMRTEEERKQEEKQAREQDHGARAPKDSRRSGGSMAAWCEAQGSCGGVVVFIAGVAAKGR